MSCQVAVWSCVLVALPVRADVTVTLGTRDFAEGSPAARFRDAFDSARRRAAATTSVWTTTPDDLGAWGPALIFPLLGSGLPSETVIALATPLEAEAVAPRLLWRTLGLYAAKSRIPFEDTPKLLAAVDRNLSALNRAAEDALVFAEAEEIRGWGPVGVSAWVAYLDLLFRDYWDTGGHGVESWNAGGLKIVERLLASARLGDAKGFATAPGAEQLELWPNALMLYALVKAYENEELVAYETAAIETVEALAALRDSDGSYFATAERKSKDPRANAYTAGALLLLAKDTGDDSYRKGGIAIIDWLVARGARDAHLETQIGYLILLLDSLATQPMENVLGRRPMHTTSAPLPPVSLRPEGSPYRAMFDGVLANLLHHVPRQNGDFAYDYGDSPGYAGEILLAAAQGDVVGEVLERQRELLSWPMPKSFTEISFGVGAFFAALAHPDLFPPEEATAALRRAVFLSGALAMADRYSMDWVDWLTGGGGFDYGPTAIGAQIAHAQLRFAQTLPQQRVGWLIDPAAVGRALVDAAGDNAWDESRGVYLAGPRRSEPVDEAVWLLPNAMMILANLQTQALTGDPQYAERAEAVAEGLEALWDAARGAYAADSTRTGADGYFSLSTNSYAALALHRLAAATGKKEHHGRAIAILDFIRRDLYRDGIVYHHVHRGRPSAGDVWCTGCNWRVLSVLREVAGGGESGRQP